MILRYDELATMMKQQKENEAQKSMEEEQRVMTSTPTRRALLLSHSILFLHHYIQSSTPHNLGVISKVTTLEMDSMSLFADSLLHLQAVFRVAGKMPLWT